jgi:hypothetical protein
MHAYLSGCNTFPCVTPGDHITEAVENRQRILGNELPVRRNEDVVVPHCGAVWSATDTAVARRSSPQRVIIHLPNHIAPVLRDEHQHDMPSKQVEGLGRGCGAQNQRERGRRQRLEPTTWS